MNCLALAAVAFALPLAAAADPPATPHVGQVSSVIYMERCLGGCTVNRGVDDSKTLTSGIPSGGNQFSMGEFKNAAGQTGPAADAEWNDLVACVQKTYSPYGAVVTDKKPTSGSYQAVVVAGLPFDIGLDGSGGGIAFVNCAPLDSGVCFVFANYAMISNPARRTRYLCGAVAQETAHNYGLSHVFAYADGRSACNDPMTYRTDCGGEQFFRNDIATCGGFTAMPCSCGAGTQNSHLRLLGVLGPGTPTTTPPVVTLNQPQDGATISGTTPIIATASAERGIAHMELWLNGYKWATVQGAPFGRDGQPETGYSLPMPADVPDGVIDIVVKAKDDIDVTTETPKITVTKGAPCVTADSCAAGQRCDAGRCLWDPASGQLGDPCTFKQFCVSEVCEGTDADSKICTQPCVVGASDACPDPSYECLETSTNQGVCYPKGAGEGNCLGCSAGSGAPPFLLGAFGLAFVLRRRRR